MDPRESDDNVYPSIGREFISRAMEFFAGMGGVIALWAVTHPDEVNMSLRRIAQYSQKRCIRFSNYWWNRARDMEQWDNRLKP